MNSDDRELPEGFGRRATDRIPAAALLEKAAEIIGQKPKSSNGDMMPSANAKEKQKALKGAQKKLGVQPPKHRVIDPADPFGTFAKMHGGVDRRNSGMVHSERGNHAATTEEPEMTEVTKTKAEQDAETAKAKYAAKEAKLAAQAKAKEDREAKAKQKEADKAVAADARAAERETKRLDREAARSAQLSGTNRTYSGPMLALADKVKAGAYVKGAHGQLRSNDALAQALDFVPPANIVKLAMLVLNEPTNKYSQLNIGQQSMNYRNRLRGALKANEGTGLEVDLGEHGGKVRVTLDYVRHVRDTERLAEEPTPKAIRVKKEASPEPDAASAEKPKRTRKPALVAVQG